MFETGRGTSSSIGHLSWRLELENEWFEQCLRSSFHRSSLSSVHYGKRDQGVLKDSTRSNAKAKSTVTWKLQALKYLTSNRAKLDLCCRFHPGVRKQSVSSEVLYEMLRKAFETRRISGLCYRFAGNFVCLCSGPATSRRIETIPNASGL